MTEYEHYLQSPEWKAKANERRRIDRGICQMCHDPFTPTTEIHHLTYRNLYHENVYTDLVTLCPECHEAVHRMMNRQVNEFGDKGWSRLRKLHEE